MSRTVPVSVFIIALNEADRIGSTIESVREWVDEVIVIDSGSADGTRDIAERLGARSLYHAWPGYGLQKRFGEEQCRNPWVLNLDADEKVTPALRNEICALFENGAQPPCDAYSVRIVEILPCEPGPSPFAHVTTAIRLYDRRRGRFSDSSVHDRVHMEKGSVAGALKKPLEHRSSRNVEHSIFKLNRYSTMQAQNLEDRAKRLPLLAIRLAFEFPVSFLKAYILRGYALRGRAGYINAMLYAFSRFARVAKCNEKERMRRNAPATYAASSSSSSSPSSSASNSGNMPSARR